MSNDRRYFDDYFKEILDGFLMMEYPYESIAFKRDHNNYEVGYKLDLYLYSSEFGSTNLGFVCIKDGDEPYLKLGKSKYKNEFFKIDESSIIYDIFNLMDHVYNESKWFRDELKKVENRIMEMTNDQYFTDISDCTYDRLWIKKNKNIKTEMKINENKGCENKVMENNLFGGNFEFGAVDGDIFKMTIDGNISIKSGDKYVIFDKETRALKDVSITSFNCNSLLYKMPTPISNIQEGDVILYNNKPYFVVYIINGENMINVIDVEETTKTSIAPIQNMFGFNYVTKVCKMMGNQTGINPIMLMMLSQGNKLDMSNLLPLIMMNKEGTMDNMLLLMMLSQGNNGDMSNLLPLLMMGNMDLNNIFK